MINTTYTGIPDGMLKHEYNVSKFLSQTPCFPHTLQMFSSSRNTDVTTLLGCTLGGHEAKVMADYPQER